MRITQQIFLKKVHTILLIQSSIDIIKLLIIL